MSRADSIEHVGQVVAEEDVVAEDQADRLAADELGADEERLGDALGLRLHRVGEPQAELRAVAEQLLDQRQVARRADDQDLADAGQHQHRQRVVDRPACRRPAAAAC